MIVEEQKQRLAPQKCPLCGQMNDVMVNGHVPEGTEHLAVNKDKGYSFCNCRNVFYTDWPENPVSPYDQDYERKYNSECAISNVKHYRLYLEMIKKMGIKDNAHFVELGAASDAMLEVAKEMGMSATGIDIMNRKSNFPFINANFDLIDEKDIPKSDIFFMSHVCEHFKYPIENMKKIFNSMNDKGYLFVSMPDPYFIDWRSPYKWGHWHLKEHHIMWDMLSFCELLEEIGFEILYKTHNPDYGFICLGDFHLVARKK